jgi:hypothetical protein
MYEHLHAFFRERKRSGAPDAARPSGNQRCFPRKAVHDDISLQLEY